jgi:hypothetical protein
MKWQPGVGNVVEKGAKQCLTMKDASSLGHQLQRHILKSLELGGDAMMCYITFHGCR